MNKNKPKKTTEIDYMIGRKMYEIRVSNGLTTLDVANKLSVSHQQYRKYELARNRIPISKLVNFSNILDVEISYFVEDDADKKYPKQDKLALALLRCFRTISDRKIKQNILNMVRTLAKK